MNFRVAQVPQSLDTLINTKKENTLGFHGKFANCEHFVLCKLTLLTWIAKTWSMVVTCQNSLSSELVNDTKSKPEKKSREMLVGVDTNWWFVFILQNTSVYCSSNTGMYLDSVKNTSLEERKIQILTH